jgi:hypothetical protein
MRKHLAAVLLVSGAVLALGIGTATATAATAKTWTVKPGGAVTGSAGKTTLKDTKTGTVLSCASSTEAVTLKKGSGQANPIGKVTSATFSTCTGPAGLKFTATTTASPSHPWNLTASTYGSGVTHATISGVMASLSGNGCSAIAAGTSATTPGTVNATYSNTTHILKISGGNLHIWNVSGCLGLVNNGDSTSFVGSYHISPSQTITSP